MQMDSPTTTTSPQAFPAGAFGPWRPLREIGRGAHGSVFLADGPGEGRVALKVCRRPDDPARMNEWEREKRGWTLYANLPAAPGLVRVLGTGETDGESAFWVAMELADPEPGGSADDPGSYRPLTLASVAAAEVALPLGRCLAIGERLAAALEHLQRHHLLHRDVKPGNVLFVRGAPVIADAGLVADDREAASLVGTPGYEPPEHHGTPQGDVFSLGPGEAASAPCAEADTSDPDFWRFLAILGKATSPVPGRRYRSAKAFRKDLARLRRRNAAKRFRKLRILLLVAALPILLPAIWNFMTFRVILMQDEAMRAAIVWPFPYRILKPLFVSRNPPPPPWKQAVDDMNESLRDLLSDLPGKRDERRKP